MKNIIITTFIISFASLASAASMDWSVSSFSWYLADGSKMAAKNTIVYLIDGTTSLDTIATAVANNTISTENWFYGSSLTTNTKGYIKDTAVSNQLVAPTEYSFSVLMVDGDKFMVSSVMKQNAYDPATEAYNTPQSITFSAARLNENSQTAGLAGAVNGWVSVPEPTSAMLFILGVAGIALKRKRA